MAEECNMPMKVLTKIAVQVCACVCVRLRRSEEQSRMKDKC